MSKKIRIKAELDDKQLKRQLADIEKERHKVRVDVDNYSVNNTIQSMKQLLKATNESTTFFGKLKTAINNTFSSGHMAMTNYLLILREINNAAKLAKQSIKEFSNATTDLAVAMNTSREKASEYLSILNKQAIDLKVTTKAVADASDSWLRQGKSIAETEKLIKDSLVLSKVGKIESAEATNYLTSALNGYKLEAKDAMSVVDKLTAVDAESASEAGGLALAMSRTASAADMAGVSMDKLIGWLAVVKETSRATDETVGNMMKTMLSRMNQVKVGKFVDAETGESLNDMERVLTEVGITMRDVNGQFISSEVVLDELGKRYCEFDSVTQRAIATQLGGAYQYEKVIALLSNYSKALQYAETAENSAGTAMQKFDNAYVDSLEAKTNLLQASFESAILKSDFDEIYSGILGATTALVDFIDKTNSLKGVTSGFAFAGIIKVFLSMRTGLNEVYISLNKFKNALNISKQTNITSENFEKLLLLSNSLSKSQMKLLLTSKNLTNTQREQILINSGLSAEEAKLQLQTWGLTTANNGLTVATTSLRNAAMGLWSTLVANPLMVITAMVSATVMAYSSYKQMLEETRQANIEAADSAAEVADKLNDLYIQYIRLSEIQEKTSSQEEEFKNIIEDITKVLGNKTKALEGLKAGTDEYTESLKDATKAELENLYVEAKIGAKSAEEELFSRAYNKWSGSNITIQQNAQMTAIPEHVAALEAIKDILADYEDLGTNGLEWEPVNWDSQQDMKGVVEYYNALIEARNRLATSDDADFLLNSDLYKNINTTINRLSESVKKYTEQQYQALKLNYEWENGIPSSAEDFRKLEENILLASGAGEHFQKILRDLLTKDFPSFSVEESTTPQPEIQSGIFSQLTSSKESLDKFTASLQTAYESYAKLMNPNISTADILSSITSINDAVSEMGGSMDWELIGSEADSLDILGRAIETVSEKYINSVLSGAGVDVNSRFGQMLANNIIQAQKASQQITSLNENIDSLQGAYSSLTDIVESYNETGHLTFDQLQTLLELEPQYLACLVDENGQLQLNEQAMMNLASQRLNDAEAQAVQQAITELGQLALQDEKTAVEDNAEAFINAVDDLSSYNTELATTIAEASIGAAAIRDLNAAINGADEQGATDDQINTVLGNLETKLKAIGDVRTKLSSGGLGSVMGGAKSKSGSSKDAWLEAYKKELAELEHIHDMEEITDREFYENLRDLNEKYFNDTSEHHEKYLDEYRSNEEKVAKGLKDVWTKYWEDYKSDLDKVSSYAERVLSRQIDSLKDKQDGEVDGYDAEMDAIDDKIDALEREKKATEERYNHQIDAIQKQIDSYNDEIDKLKEISEEKNRQLKLEQDIYELERLRNQKTQKEYVEGRGIVYKVDSGAIRDQEQQVENDRLEIEIAGYEKLIKGLEAQQDSLKTKMDDIISSIDAQIDKLNDQKDGIQDRIDAVNKSYESQIEALEKYKDKWSEVSEHQSMLEEEAIARQLFGANAETAILEMRTGILDDYIGRYQMASDNLAMISEAKLHDISGILTQMQTSADTVSLLSGGLQDSFVTFQTTFSEFNSAANAVDTTNVKENLSTAGTVADSTSGQLENITTKLNELAAEVSSFTLPPLNTEQFTASLGTADSATGILGQLRTFTERFRELCMSIPTVWNGVLSAISGSGLVSGEDRDYNALFTPLLAAMDNCKFQMDTKLAEYVTAWTDFNMDLGAVIGTGGDTGTSSGGDKKSVKDARKPKGGNKENGDISTDSIVGTIQSGGDMINAVFDDTWVPGFKTMGEQINEICQKVVECVNEMAENTVDACRKAVDAINKANAAKKSSSSSNEKPEKFRGNTYTGRAFARGTLPLKQGVDDALVGELGAEIVANTETGAYRIVGRNGAEFTDLNKGDVVISHTQTEQILRDNSLDYLLPQFADVVLSPEFMTQHIKPQFKNPMEDYYDEIQAQMNMQLGAAQKARDERPVNITFGDISLPNVTDADSFSNEVIKTVTGAIEQKIHMRK